MTAGDTKKFFVVCVHGPHMDVELDSACKRLVADVTVTRVLMDIPDVVVKASSGKHLLQTLHLQQHRGHRGHVIS